MLGDPVNLVDPSGLYVETGVDVAFVVYDITTLALGCGSWSSLALDTAGIFLPGIAGLGHTSELYRAAKGAGRFAPGKWLSHFEKHGAEFGYKNSMEYLQGARSLIGRKGVQTYTRANGDQLFYDAASNEFAVMTKDGVIRTYFRPETGGTYWQGQIGG